MVRARSPYAPQPNKPPVIETGGFFVCWWVTYQKIKNDMWKKIKDFETYSVSDKGEVRNDETGLVLRQREDKDGYLTVNLHQNKRRRFAGVHRIMAETFIPNPNNLPQVNHRDENVKNNTLENLEWCDAKYNSNYGKHNTKISRANSKKVYQYYNGELVGWFQSTRLAGKILGINPNGISDCCRGVKKSAGGFTWKYAS